MVSDIDLCRGKSKFFRANDDALCKSCLFYKELYFISAWFDIIVRNCGIMKSKTAGDAVYTKNAFRPLKYQRK